MANRRSSKSNYIVQGSILAAASILVRIIGMLYRIPVNNIIGDVGMDYYSGAFEIYNIILLISSYSLPLAVSKLVAARVKLNQYRNAMRLFRGAMMFALAAGAVGALFTFFCADFLASEVVHTPQSSPALKVLAAAVFILAIMGVIRGYFQGLGTMMPTAVSQIIEQIVNAIVSIAAAGWLFRYGLELDQEAGILLGTTAASYGAAGSTLGTSAGALAGLLFLIAVMLLYNRVLQRRIKKDQTRRLLSYSSLMKTLLLTILPVILSTAIYNVNGIIDQGVFKYLMLDVLKEDPLTVSQQWGAFTGKYKLLTNVPIAVASALSASTIPALTAARISGSTREMQRKTDGAIRMVMMVCIPSAVGLMALGSPIVELLFHEGVELSGKLLLYGSVSVVFCGLSTLTNGILQGIDQMRLPVIHAAVALVLHLVLLVVLVLTGDLGIYAVMASYVFFALIMCVLNGIAIRKHLRYRQELRRTFLVPILSSAIMGISSWLIYDFLNEILGNLITLCICLPFAVLVYGIFILVLQGVTEAELLSFPKGRTLARILKKVHLL
ncbi:MAG: polysaccharide biosynthesis protein [Lachnospiraceae bacterium]|nr:polysaccharide biosynthesis protein [Lachnospiraceae bacterium]